MTKDWKEISEVEFIDKRMYSLGEILEKCAEDPSIHILYYSEYDQRVVITNTRDLTINIIRTCCTSQNAVFIRLKEKYSTEIIKEEIK